jgi:stringent starvation protein B
MSERRRPSKKDVMLDLLSKSGVFVYLDPRREGVVIPVGFKKQPELMLQIGLNMAVAIRDLEVDEEGITCTLSFNRSPFWCRMPWHAVFALISDADSRGVVWAEDAPRESKMARAPAVEPPRPRLRAVGPDERAPEPEPEPAKAIAREAVEGEGTCNVCNVKWVADQDACPLCGSSREEAFRAAGASSDGDDDDAPEAEAPKIPLALRAFESVGEVDEPSPMSTEMPEPASPPALRAVPSEPPEPAAAAEPAVDPAAEIDDDVPGPKGKAKKPLPPWLRVVK